MTKNSVIVEQSKERMITQTKAKTNRRMNSIIRNALAVLLLVLGSAPSLYAQESTSSLPKFFEISNDREWTSQLLEFDEPVDGFRLTVFRTSHSDRLYEGYPYVCLATCYEIWSTM